jgi:hypothetical protein
MIVNGENVKLAFQAANCFVLLISQGVALG